MSVDLPLTKENIDTYLAAVAKQFRKLGGKAMPAEITLIGGASILVNYGFRDATYDIDALIHASSAMKDAINYVTDTMSLPTGWLNDDFKNTKSYTPKLVNYSKYYRMFSNVLTVRTITGEYLVAMKLMAYRQYKHDISDIVGILSEQERQGEPLSFSQIDKAVCDLYEGWHNLPEQAEPLIREIMENENLEALYRAYASEEAAAKDTLITFEEKYPDVLQEDNLDDILKHLQSKVEAEESENLEQPEQGIGMTF